MQLGGVCRKAGRLYPRAGRLYPRAGEEVEKIKTSL